MRLQVPGNATLPRPENTRTHTQSFICLYLPAVTPFHLTSPQHQGGTPRARGARRLRAQRARPCRRTGHSSARTASTTSEVSAAASKAQKHRAVAALPPPLEQAASSHAPTPHSYSQGHPSTQWQVPSGVHALHPTRRAAASSGQCKSLAARTCHCTHTRCNSKSDIKGPARGKRATSIMHSSSRTACAKNMRGPHKKVG
jgi:hypothetical protein